MNNAEEARWTTRDELLYLKNIGKTLDLGSRKATQKDMLKGYIKGLKKRFKTHGDSLAIDTGHCIKEAYLMLSDLK
jgi:hypothetical protein